MYVGLLEPSRVLQLSPPRLSHSEISRQGDGHGPSPVPITLSVRMWVAVHDLLLVGKGVDVPNRRIRMDEVMVSHISDAGLRGEILRQLGPRFAEDFDVAVLPFGAASAGMVSTPLVVHWDEICHVKSWRV